MTALSDVDILRAQGCKQLNIEPWDDSRVKPNSVDLTLGQDFLWINANRILTQHNARHNIQYGRPGPVTHPNGVQFAVDPFGIPGDLYSRERVGLSSAYVLKPLSFALGSTVEKVTLSRWLCGRLEGKSSLARLGIAIHSTAGFIDAGFSGTITLELFNFSPLPILLHPGMAIAQIFFQRLDSPAAVPYGEHPDSKYQDSDGVVGSLYDQNTR